jgi:hypothetical protein
MFPGGAATQDLGRCRGNSRERHRRDLHWFPSDFKWCLAWESDPRHCVFELSIAIINYVPVHLCPATYATLNPSLLRHSL